ncbi:MAG TPA: hypothetical protein VF403_27930 [Kofleriaceae bacterium]
MEERRTFWQLLPWFIFAAAGLYQVGLLVYAIAGRVSYPYDLEWMEGGMLHHALRIQEGHSLYAPPSIDFIPYLYTPLYPALLAMLGKVFGLTYALGRAISILSLIVMAGVAFSTIVPSSETTAANMPRARVIATRFARRFVAIAQPIAWCGAILSLGLFAAIYPFVEGWYDLVRADTLFLGMATAAIAAMPYLARSQEGWRGHARVAGGAAMLALAFFCKQTGIFYVALGGAIVAVINWRRVAAYVATAGAIGLAGTQAMNSSTDGWFWTYISKIHRAHDFNWDRFWASFGNILWHFPAMTIVIAAGAIALAATWLRTRELPDAAPSFLLWLATFALSIVVGCIGWGTEFAHFNAYMPAFLHGAFAAGAALPLLAQCAQAWRTHDRLSENDTSAMTTVDSRIAQGFAGLAAAALAFTCIHARWSPSKFIPTARDVAAGDKLIKHIASLEGDVWMPSHPWYLVLAGKQPHVHRMGIKDVTTRQNRTIAGMDEALRTHQFSAIVMDDRDLFLELPQLAAQYHPALKLPDDERPRVFTGAHVVPDTVWLPRLPAKPPAGVAAVFDFETPTWQGWTRSGPAWGDGPAIEPESGQGLIVGVTGQRFANSMHGGDIATGRMTSPSFVLDGARISLLVGGGTDDTKLRAELWCEDKLVRTAGVPAPGGESLQRTTWMIDDDIRGKRATLVLVDDSPTGHLVVDDVWLWTNP